MALKGRLESVEVFRLMKMCVPERGHVVKSLEIGPHARDTRAGRSFTSAVRDDIRRLNCGKRLHAAADLAGAYYSRLNGVRARWGVAGRVGVV